MKGEGRSSKKCLAYVAAFIIFQGIVIAVFALTVMKVKSPKARFGTITAENFSSGNSNGPSFGMDLKAQFAVKNTNFGHFKYENSTVTVLYQGMPVGEAFIPRARARARSTRRFDITIPISSSRLTNTANLGNDINSGVLTLTSQAKLSGKVHLMKVIKKKKSGEMSCIMLVNLKTRAVQDLKCK
ncbi:late embryogenesis abundant protein At1g64065-like [Humulus lupulus]|uniref:late embryogenesis abundant protein At1g64065-like n=1 Tax=Humulus lupulus TaxID=3486 RepID=UPI002B40D2A4|nr:late embryogenesis abundant protein At1g64065-like [Humulus lupulus]